MHELNSLIESGKLLKGEFKNREDFFKHINEYLLKEGYVTEKFFEKLLEREIMYPTGLQTKSICVSLPHCESEYVYKNGIIVAVFSKPVEFNRMDDPDESIEVKVSFVLLVKDKERHLPALQQLMILFQSEQLAKIVEAESLEEVLELIRIVGTENGKERRNFV